MSAAKRHEPSTRSAAPGRINGYRPSFRDASSAATLFARRFIGGDLFARRRLGRRRSRARCEPLLAGTGRSGLPSEDETLRLVLEIGDEAIEAARGARELFDQEIDARQRFARDGVRNGAD